MYIKDIYFFIQKSTNVTVIRVKIALHVWMEWTGIHVSVNQVSSEPIVKQVIVLIEPTLFMVYNISALVRIELCLKTIFHEGCIIIYRQIGHCYIIICQIFYTWELCSFTVFLEFFEKLKKILHFENYLRIKRYCSDNFTSNQVLLNGQF